MECWNKFHLLLNLMWIGLRSIGWDWITSFGAVPLRWFSVSLRISGRKTNLFCIFWLFFSFNVSLFGLVENQISVVHIDLVGPVWSWNTDLRVTFPCLKLFGVLLCIVDLHSHHYFMNPNTNPNFVIFFRLTFFLKVFPFSTPPNLNSFCEISWLWFMLTFCTILNHKMSNNCHD